MVDGGNVDDRAADRGPGRRGSGIEGRRLVEDQLPAVLRFDAREDDALAVGVDARPDPVAVDILIGDPDQLRARRARDRVRGHARGREILDRRDRDAVRPLVGRLAVFDILGDLALALGPFVLVEDDALVAVRLVGRDEDDEGVILYHYEWAKGKGKSPRISNTASRPTRGRTASRSQQ